MTETYDDRFNKSENATRYIKQRVEDIAPTLDSDDDSSKKKAKRLKPALWTSVLAGGLAGVAVDIGLYPLDTIKTRLQSKEGFRSSGGFRKVYQGIFPVLLTSAPLSALFFGTYNTLVNTLRTEDSSLNPFVYLAAASAAELICSVFRIPVEILKQRKQISKWNSFYIIRKTYKKEGFLGFYRGFWTVILREMPFAAIQYPLWEYMINQLIIYQNGESLTPLQIAYCGAAAGAVAAMVTTPVDVIKTRVMLAEREKLEQYKPKINLNIAKEVYCERGIFGFFAGVTPRTLWIMLGGFIYFGAYEQAKLILEQRWCFFKGSVSKVREISPSYFEEKLENFAFWTESVCPNTENNGNSGTQERDEDRILFQSQKQKIVDTTLLEPSNDSIEKK